MYTKKLIRAKALKRRRKLHAEKGRELKEDEHGQSALDSIAARCLRIWSGARRSSRRPLCAGYKPIGAEFNVTPVLQRLKEHGWQMCYPEVDEKNQKLYFLNEDGGRELSPAFVIAPVVAFDGDCRRLGRGGGHYDRTIKDLREQGGSGVVICGVAYEGQRRGDLASVQEAHDQPLDFVLTEVTTYAMSDSPPKLTGDKVGTFAHDTVTRRLREEILGRVFEENEKQLSQEALSALRELDHEMETAASSKLTPIKTESGSTDTAIWDSLLSDVIKGGLTWTTAPWLLVEFYFFRRISAATAFSETGFDVYQIQKAKGIEAALPRAAVLVKETEALISKRADILNAGLRFVFLVALWGNQADLSLWPVEGGSAAKIVDPEFVTRFAASASEGLSANLVADDFTALHEYIKSRGKLRRVDIITDNAGLEFLSDLCLIVYLIRTGIASNVTLRVKPRPVYVSDVMVKDVTPHIQAMQKVSPNFSKSCDELIESGELKIETDEFFGLPTPLWEMPEHLKSDFMANSDLVVIKGDANYRRLLEDREWELTTPLSETCARHFPVPFLALRTIKAEMGAGMDGERIARAKSVDAKWMTDGMWGVIQFLQ